MLYPIGVQNFESIRQGGYVYVDKTALVHRLVTTGKYYFLSRPRRFGKSLLVSTLEAYFQGKKELFTGLALEKLEKVWNSYPILHLDLSGKEYNTMDDLDVRLDRHLSQWENSFGFEKRYPMADARFSDIIDAAYEKTGKPVVILIDEYDKPLLDTAGNEPLREAFRSRLQGFYSVMKSQDGSSASDSWPASPSWANSASSAGSTASTTFPWTRSFPAFAGFRKPTSSIRTRSSAGVLAAVTFWACRTMFIPRFPRSAVSRPVTGSGPGCFS